MQNMSSQKNMEMLSHMQCPFCKRYMFPPIYQCNTGHSICLPCRGLLQKCPICKDNISVTRNYVLESLVLLLNFPCSFASYGCKVIQRKQTLTQHEEICTYRPRTCPFCPKGSAWKGIIDDLELHLTDNHGLFELFNGEQKPLEPYFMPVDGNDIKNYLFVGRKPFYFYQVNNNGEIACIVKYIGDKADAKNFAYTVTVFSKSDDHRKITAVEVCSDETTSLKEIIASGLYISLSKAVIFSYSEVYCSLKINCRTLKN